MKKLLRYLVNTILFVVLWFIPVFIIVTVFPFVGISLPVSGTRPSVLGFFGGMISIIISYELVTRINKSNLWIKLFQEEDTKEYKYLKKIMIVIFGIFLIILSYLIIRDLILYILIPYLIAQGYIIN